MRGSLRPNRTAAYWPPPNSSGCNSVSFPFSWAAQPGAWGPSLSGCWFSLRYLISNYNCSIGVLLCVAFSTASCLQLIWSPTDWLTPSLYPGYIIIWCPLFFLRASQFRTHSTRLRSRLYSSTGCTCYLYRCISCSDSLAGSEVNMQQSDSVEINIAFVRMVNVADIVFTYHVTKLLPKTFGDTVSDFTWLSMF